MTAVKDVKAVEVAALRNATLRLARRLRKQADLDLTPSQMSGLSTLERHDTMRVGELARREQIGKSSATRLVARLEVLGLARRQPDPIDGRSFFVELTDHGRQLLGKASEQANDYLARQVAELTPEDRKLLMSALPVLERLATSKP
jgi:DNA-binding MarR family transcriptional regulator